MFCCGHTPATIAGALWRVPPVLKDVTSDHGGVVSRRWLNPLTERNIRRKGARLFLASGGGTTYRRPLRTV
jgi:hypothetical protein